MSSARRMIPLEDGWWAVQCRACPRRSKRSKTFETKPEAYEWWRNHSKTAEHIQCATPITDEERAALRWWWDVFGGGQAREFPTPWGEKREALMCIDAYRIALDQVNGGALTSRE